MRLGRDEAKEHCFCREKPSESQGEGWNDDSPQVKNAPANKVGGLVAERRGGSPVHVLSLGNMKGVSHLP
jgi:hypothetical protein